jgi:hypothetical protein
LSDFVFPMEVVAILGFIKYLLIFLVVYLVIGTALHVFSGEFVAPKPFSWATVKPMLVKILAAPANGILSLLSGIE